MINTASSLNRLLESESPDDFQTGYTEISAKKAKERWHLFVSVITNIAAISPSFTWVFFLPYMYPYFYQTGSKFDASEVQIFFLIQIVTVAITEPIVAIAVRNFDAKFVVLLGYFFVLVSSGALLFINDFRLFIIMQGFFGSLGASIVFFSSLLVLWEWFSPMNRGLLTGIVFGVQALFASGVLYLQLALINPGNQTGIVAPTDPVFGQ